MKNISLYLTTLFCLTVLCGCSIHTVTYEKIGELPKLKDNKIPHKLYVAEIKNDGAKQPISENLRKQLSRENSKIFTDNAKEGIPVKVSLKKIKSYTENGTLNMLGFLTLTIFPISTYENVDYELELDACGAKGSCPFQHSHHSILGLTPLTYIAYPFVGWFSAEKGFSLSHNVSLVSPDMNPFFSAAAERIDVQKMLSGYACRPKELIPDSLKTVLANQDSFNKSQYQKSKHTHRKYHRR